MRKRFCRLGILDCFFICLFSVMPVIIFALTFLNKYDIIASSFLAIIFILLFILSIHTTEFIHYTDQELIVKNIFGRILRQYKWNELKEIKPCFLQCVQYSYNCFVLRFSNKSIDSYNLIEENNKPTTELLFLHKDLYVKKRMKYIIIALNNQGVFNDIDGIDNFIA